MMLGVQGNNFFGFVLEKYSKGSLKIGLRELMAPGI